MAKKKTQTKTQAKKVNNGLEMAKSGIVNNGLSEAVFGVPFDQLSQLSQSDTLFKNLRYYLVSNMRQLLSQLYVEHGLVQTVVDVPVDDALGRGFEIISRQLDENQIEELQFKMEEQNDHDTLAQALKWNRLYGGAGIIIMTGQDQTEKFDIESIKKDSLLEFRAADLWELFHNCQKSDDQLMGLKVDKLPMVDQYNYYGQKLDATRVMPIRGIPAPSFIRPRLRGWGLSVIETLVRSINQYLKATDLSFEVLDEFKVDIFKIKGLTNSLLNKEGAQQINTRLSLANTQKNFQNAIAMDGEDDYQQKQLSFTGIAEAMNGIRLQVASDLRMPMTKLFGMSSAGFNSGEDDIENYNAMIESTIRAKSKFHAIKMVKLRCAQLFGFVPDDLRIEFPSLRIMSSEQEENVKTQKFNRLLQARQSGDITNEEFRQGVNKENLCEIQLEIEGEEV